MVRWCVIIVPFVLLSCGTSVTMMRQGSMFSGTNLLISAADRVSKHGKPFSTSVEKVDQKKLETYYYVEIIRKENPFSYSGDVAIAVQPIPCSMTVFLVKQDNNIDFGSQERCND